MTQIDTTMLSTSQLKERGWTPALITTFLGHPDVLKPNPYYRSSPPWRLYDVSRVEQAEQTEEWQQAQASATIRSIRGKMVAARQATKLRAQAELLPIAVIRVPLTTVVRRAIASYNAFHAEMLAERGHDYEPASEQSDTAFLERISVNFIRHELTEYDTHLEELAGRVGVSIAQIVIRRRVYDEIARIYPEYADECQRQIQYRSLEAGAA